MGYFLAVSAFRHSSTDQIGLSIVDFAREHGVECEVLDRTQRSYNEGTDVTVFKSVKGWVTVLWPEYFNIHDFPVCQALSKINSTLVSTIHVYDSAYWAHGLFDRGVLLDRFSSLPDYFSHTDTEASRQKEEWRGNAQLIASTFDVEAETVEGYLVHLPNPEPPRSSWFRRRPPVPPTPTGTVHADDEFDISDFWVFTDFWRRLGIKYPDDLDDWASRIRFLTPVAERLPLMDED